ncbi:Oidioi.mRNA.OKI2018_I69.chr2.g4370.t1.cds [Oikopleura dioica]|uniref:Oidioi.mRNA.OKI2018_I69.chr2.g4370.t1.cds n=1 Tax=Oikopleura dioica TaxID=34765 RepID=A0ABN7T0K9_OIKDI|nr:Oidioi.mRNA.OKI2018_I69.chr2.g4370.t1.cds [Oikopleura dioica]
MAMRFNNYAPSSNMMLNAEASLKAMSLLDELKGIVIDQQRGIRERDTKLATLQQQYDALNTSYWTIMQKVRSYDHLFGILTNNAKNAASSSLNGITNPPQNGTSSVPTPSPSLPQTDESQADVTNVKESKEEAQETETKPESLPVGMGTPGLNPALFSLANSFALDRFAGVSMMNLGSFNSDLSPDKASKLKMKSPSKSTVKLEGQTKPYTCKVCGRRFTDRSNCIKHQFIHTGLKPFECPHCNKRFRRKDHLNSHCKSQHGEEAFPPGVPAPRLSIVAATSQLPNIIGNLHNSSLLSNGSQNLTNGNGISSEQCSIEINEDSNEGSLEEPSPKKIKMEETNCFDEEELTIDELGENDENVAIEPAEVDTKPAFSKEIYDKIMNE